MVAWRESGFLIPAIEKVKMVFFQNANVSYDSCCENFNNQSIPMLTKSLLNESGYPGGN